MSNPPYPTFGRRYYTKEEYEMLEAIREYRPKLEELGKVKLLLRKELKKISFILFNTQNFTSHSTRSTSSGKRNKWHTYTGTASTINTGII